MLRCYYHLYYVQVFLYFISCLEETLLQTTNLTDCYKHKANPMNIDLKMISNLKGNEVLKNNSKNKLNH